MTDKRLNEENIRRILTRHQALVNLVYHLQANIDEFFDFLQCIQAFEKALETGDNAPGLLCTIFEYLIKDEYHLKRLFFSQEWQIARDHFQVSTNEDALIDVCNVLEIGCKDQVVMPKTIALRRKLLHNAFFMDQSGQVKYKDVLIEFVFSDEVVRWSIIKIAWQLHRDTELKLCGKIYISLGKLPDYDSDLYKKFFAVFGSKKQTVANIALGSLATDDNNLKELAQKLLIDVDFELAQLLDKTKGLPENWQKSLEDWQTKPCLYREFAPESLAFLLELMVFCEKHAFMVYEYLKQRFLQFGFMLLELKSPKLYEFSEDIPEGEVISCQPILKYYWPPDDLVKTATASQSFLSAGKAPAFLKEIQKLAKQGKISLRDEDFHIARQMLLYLKLGDKVPRPPLSPLYNALRRWLEALTNAEEYILLEQLCNYAKIFRPTVHIPCVGEKLSDTEGRRHKIQERLAPDKKPGTILNIKKSAIIISKGSIPLFLKGEYILARAFSIREKFLEVLSPLLVEDDNADFQRAWKNLCHHEDLEDILIVLRSLARSQENLEASSWNVICGFLGELCSKIKDTTLNLQETELIDLLNILHELKQKQAKEYPPDLSSLLQEIKAKIN